MTVREMMEAERASRLEHEAARLGIDRRAWVRMDKLAETEAIGGVAVSMVRNHVLYSDKPVAVVLSSLLADVLDNYKVMRERFEELAATVPAPPILIVRKDSDR